MNHPELPRQTGVLDRDTPPKILLKPGDSYPVPIKSLARESGRQSYWLLPGEYSLHASIYVWVTPAPEGVEHTLSDGSGLVKLEAPPSRVKVVAEKK